MTAADTDRLDAAFQPVPIDFPYTNDEWARAHLVTVRLGLTILSKTSDTPRSRMGP